MRHSAPNIFSVCIQQASKPWHQQKKLKVDQATKGVKRKLEDSQLDDDAFTTPTKCARRIRTADDLTSRTVTENFADFNDHQLHVLRAEANDNRTLIEELVMQNNLRMSKSPMAQKTGKNYTATNRVCISWTTAQSRD